MSSQQLDVFKTRALVTPYQTPRHETVPFLYILNAPLTLAVLVKLSASYMFAAVEISWTFSGGFAERKCGTVTLQQTGLGRFSHRCFMKAILKTMTIRM